VAARKKPVSNRRPSQRVEQFIAQIPGVDYGVLDDLVGYALRRAQLRIYLDFFQALEPWSVTPPRFSAMTLIHQNPGLKLTDLAQAMGIARSGAVHVVRSLEKMGYVQRSDSSTDRRAHSLALSLAGQQAYRDIQLAIRRHDARISARLSPAEQSELRRLLGLLG
jgi:DNA-binding MarR family transcriptional regulator